MPFELNSFFSNAQLTQKAFRSLRKSQPSVSSLPSFFGTIRKLSLYRGHKKRRKTLFFMSIFHKIFLYISCFIPLYFLIIVKELVEIINTNLSFNITNTIMLAINFLLILVGVYGVVFQHKKVEYQRVEIVEYQNQTCQNFLPYFALFVLFAIAFELEFVSMALVYVLVLVMLGIVYVKNNMFYINPFLNILGFSVYEITYKNDDKIITEKIFSKFSPQKHFQKNFLFLK